jgi:pimeloyl-ACP methyl ester carboxylesterase
VLILPGSGPTDRDGNSPNGVQAATYRLLAEGLAEHGITSVRVDKRGIFGSRAAIADANAATIDDYAADVRTWVSALRQRTGASCVWVMGHSEGGLVALVAGQQPAEICGLVLVSTAGRPLGKVIAEQLRTSQANSILLDQALPAITKLEAGEKVDTRRMHPSLLPLFRPEVQNLLINEFSFDPAKLIASTQRPVLILQGQRDIQVGVADAELLGQANPSAKLVVLQDTNHVLKTVTTNDRAENISTYVDPGLPLAPGAVEAIADFIGGIENPAMLSP